MADKKDNPSHYAMVTISEGAMRTAAGIVETGEEDAYGHRKLGGIGAQAGRCIRAIDRRGHHLPAGRLPDALRQPGLPRPDGGHQLRRDGHRPGLQRPVAAAWWPYAAAPTPTCRSR